MDASPEALTASVVDKIHTVSCDTDFGENFRKQAAMVHLVARSWVRLNVPQRERVKLAISAVIPRIKNANNPSNALERLIELHVLNERTALSDITRSIISQIPPKEYIPCPEEHMFPTTGWIGSFMDFGRHNAVPAGFNFWAAITALGAACKHNVFIDRGIERMYLNWYTLLTGNKSTGKSASREMIYDIIKRANRMVLGGTPESPDKPNPDLIRILGEDSTKESLIDELKITSHVSIGPDGKPVFGFVDSTGFLIVDELVNLLGRQSYGVESKVGFLTAIYSSQDYKKSTVGGGKVVLDNIALSMLACCAPAWMMGAVVPLLLDGGVVDRWRVIYRHKLHSPREYDTPHPGDPVLANILAGWLLPLMTLKEEIQLLETKRTKELFKEYYHEEFVKDRRSADGEEKMSVNRFTNQTLRMAGVMTVGERVAVKGALKDYPFIEDGELETAIKINGYESVQFSVLMGTITADPIVNQLDYIQTCLLEKNGLVPMMELHERLRKKKGFLPWAKLGKGFLQDLLESKHITIVKLAAAGKKRYYCLTNVGLKYLDGKVRDEKTLDHARATLYQFGLEQLTEVEARRLTV